MKQLLISLFLYSPTLMAQTFSGNWQGAIAAVQNANQEYPASMSLRAAGSQLTGSVTAQVPTGTETYRVNAQINGMQAAGTVTDAAAGTSMNVELALNNGKMVVAFGLNNVPVIMGVFTQQGGTSKAAPQASNVPSQQRAQDRLPRNNRLVGVWVYSNTYRSGGDFRFTSRSFLYFFPDGRLGSSAGEAAASYDGAAGSSYMNTGADGGINFIQGAVWYTKGGQVWLHDTLGKLPDVIWGEFFINENGSAMHLNRGKGNVLYERTQ